MDGFHDLGPLVLHYKWFMGFFANLPRWLVLKINPGFGTFIKFKLVRPRYSVIEDGEAESLAATAKQYRTSEKSSW